MREKNRYEEIGWDLGLCRIPQCVIILQSGRKGKVGSLCGKGAGYEGGSHLILVLVDYVT